MQPISSIDTIIHTNTSLETAIKESGGKEGLEKLFHSAIGGNNPFVDTLEKHGVFKAKRSFEDNIELLVNTMLLAETRILQKGKKAPENEIQSVHVFGKNLLLLIALIKEQNTHIVELAKKNSLRVSYKTTSAIKRINTTEKKLAVALTKLAELQTHNQKAKQDHLEYAKVSESLKPYEELLKNELGLNIQFFSQIQKSRHATANKINAYLSDFENMETLPPKSWTGSLKTYLGFGEQTEYGASNRGSLSRGIYTNIFNRLCDTALELRFLQTKNRFGEILEHTGQILAEAKMLKLVAHHKTSQLKKKKPELLQAERAVQLMKLREFINKAHFFAETKKKIGHLNKKFTELYAMIGVHGDTPFSQKQLTSITKKEIETLWQQVAEKLDAMLSDSDGKMSWSEKVVQGETSAKSWNSLVNEFIDGLENIS